jgi:adenine-specific DNA-methyltransferase
MLEKLKDNSIDLTITSPPYCMGKSYEDPKEDVDDFIKSHEKVLPSIVRATKEGGSICWQIGYHVTDNEIVPLDFLVYELAKNLGLKLRNRIIWSFGHGLNSPHRFSGRHETILWFTKGNTKYHFDLDKVRVPQKYPGKRYYKGDKKGEFSGNPLGKNPSDIWFDVECDVWDIPNVKANHVEKTQHPCQFPVSIPRRLIRALCPTNGIVLDPFVGSGSTAIACVIENRKFIGAELKSKYCKDVVKRYKLAKKGKLPFRSDSPAKKPDLNSEVARKPSSFLY